MVEKPVEKPWNWADQAAHFGSCWGLTVLTCGYGAPAVALWAITREYYQTKITMFEVNRIQYPDLNWKQISKQLHFSTVWTLVDLTKRDLVVSYWGVVAGVLTAIPVNLYLFAKLKEFF